VLMRVTPDVAGETHEKISTGQADSKFGFSMGEAQTAIAQIEGIDGLALAGLHAHIGSQAARARALSPRVAELAKLGDGVGGFSTYDLGGGLGVAYTEAQSRPPAIEEYVAALVRAAEEHGMGTPGRRC